MYYQHKTLSKEVMLHLVHYRVAKLEVILSQNFSGIPLFKMLYSENDDYGEKISVFQL
jgi:hypothetical protein